MDDLQWSDAPTLNLLQRLVTSRELSHLFLIGAYRNNEVDVGHPLSLCLGEIQKTKQVNELFLEPLNEQSVVQLIADTLHRSKQEVNELAKLLFQKSEGNPFFINVLLKNLYEDGSIVFDTKSGKWKWDMQSVLLVEISGDVVDYVVNNLKILASETQQVLQLAACIGNTFDLKTLSIIQELSMQETSNKLVSALKKNVIIPLDQNYKFVSQRATVSNNTSMLLDQEVNPRYKFQHDQVQKAAYALIDEHKKQLVHLSIGRLMLKHSNESQTQERVIDIVEHLNEGKHLIVDVLEKQKLAQLNLLAGTRAKNSSAYESALVYLETGLQILPGDPWHDDYALIKQLNIEIIQCTYLTGKYQETKTRIDAVLEKVKTNLEKAEILSMRTRQYATIGKMEESIQAAISGLALLGEKFTDKPNNLAVQKEILKVRINLGKREIASLIDEPDISDPGKMIAIRLLMEIFPAAFLSGTGHLFPYLILKSVNLSLRNGNSPETAFAYAAYGMLLCGTLQEPARGLAFGKLGVALNDHYNDTSLKSRIIYVYAMFIHHWSNHWSSMTPWFKKGIEAGYESGDLLYLAYSAQDCVIWDPKLDLDTLCTEQKKYLSIVKDCEYQDSYDSGTLFLQLQLNLMGLTDGRYSMNDDEFDEERCVDGMRQRKFMTGIANYQIYKTEIYYIYENYVRALEQVQIQDKMVDSSMSLPQLVRYSLIAFLTLTASFPTFTKKEKASTLKRLKSDLAQMSKWAKNCPDNFLHIQYLMQAELCRLANKTEEAMNNYAAAIKEATKYEFRRDAALAHELFGKFFLQSGQNKAAEGYFKASQYLYYRLGAKRKVEHMQEFYPELLTSERRYTDVDNVQEHISNESELVDSDSMDFSSVMQASQTISGEIVLEQLLKKVMQILLENAGGQLGLFIQRKQGELIIDATSEQSETDNVSEFRVPHESEILEHRMPVTLINYVLQTNTHLVIDNASDNSEFRTDPYILKYKPRSIICIPVIRNRQFERVIYIENNVASGAFTQERVKVLKLLAEQASISIENAQLYDNLEHKVEERTFELMTALDDLKITQSQLLQSEKMAGLGSLVAGVAHEINNPTNFVNIGANTLDEELNNFKDLLYELVGEDNDPEVIELFNERFDRFFLALGNIKEGASRIRTIVLDLRTFSRLDEADKKTVPLVENIESTLRLIESQFKDHIHFVCDFQDNPEIDCFPAQLNQVFMNMMMNACQAIMDKPLNSNSGEPQSERGSLTITTKTHYKEVEICFTDTGVGMNEQVKQKIFEPFFTTKEVGEGTGMGMSISFQIIEKHKGRFEIESQVGVGTSISVFLPK